MPLLPTYESKQDTIQPKANTAVTTQPFQGGGEEAKVGAKAMGEMGETVDKFIEIKDTMEYTKVTANAEVAIAKQKLLAAQDTNPDNAQFHIDELQKIKKDATKGFTNKFTAQKVGMELDHKIEVGTLDIGGEFFKKKLFANKINLDTTIDTKLQEKISTQDPIRRAAIDQEIAALVNSNHASGLITDAEAENYLTNARTMSVKYDIYNDPAKNEESSQVLKDLRDTSKYTELTSKERLELTKEAQTRIFQNNQTYKRDITESQNIRHDALLDTMSQRDITYSDIENELAIPPDQGGIPKKTLVAYQKGLERNIDTTLNNMLKEKNVDKEPTKRAKSVKEYNDLINMFIDDQSDQWLAKEALANAWANGAIDGKEAKFLNALKTNLKDIEFNRSTSPVAKAIKGVKDFFKMQKNSTDEDLAFNTKQLLDSISNGDTPDVALKKVMDGQLKAVFSDYTTYPKDGRIKIDKVSGRQYKVFPDGTWAWETKVSK